MWVRRGLRCDVRGGFIIGLISSLGALFLGSCGGDPNSAEVRWRMTVEVETPDGTRTGSSVWSWELSRPTLALASPYEGQFRGEAVAVELPNGSVLFALVRDQEQVPERQFRKLRSSRDKEDRIADLRDIADHVGATKRLACAAPETGNNSYDYDFPILVTFTNPGDPLSVVEVDYHNANAVLGEGCGVHSITASITEDEVTNQIDTWLPLQVFRRWGAISKAERSKGSVLNNPYFDTLAGKLSRNDFTTEAAQ